MARRNYSAKKKKKMIYAKSKKKSQIIKSHALSIKNNDILVIAKQNLNTDIKC